MQDDAVKNNYFTQPDRRPPKSRDKGEISEILKLSPDLPYVHTADICGAKIQLRTNSKHVSELWQLNWFIIDSKNSDGIIYVIIGVEGYEPHLYYNLEKKIIVIVNSEYYGAVKSAGALGLSGVILKEKAYPIHGACISVENDGVTEGVIIIAPTGTGKTTQSHELIYNISTTKVHSDDYVFVFFENGKVIAKATEKHLYMRTDIAKDHPTFIERFHEFPLENVVTKKEKCAQMSDDKDKIGPCYRRVLGKERTCVFDNGNDRCYWSYGNSRVMFPRREFPMLIKDKDGNLKEVIKGEDRVINEVPVKIVLLLTRDNDSPPVTKLDCEQAYPPELDKVKQEKFFRKLFNSGVSFYLLNTGSFKKIEIMPHQTHMYIRHIIGI